MKRILFFMTLVPVLCFGQWQESQQIFNVKDNVLTISHKGDKAEVFRNWKLLLNDEMYSLKNYDADIFAIETDYKPGKNVSTRLMISVKDSVILLRGFATNNMSVQSGMLQGEIAELRNEYRASKLTVMAVGFNEMFRLAGIYKQRHNGSIGSYRE